jgi:competence protein ComEC
MAAVHFLNVGEGDCTIIEHNSGHKTVVDLCNGYFSLSIPSSMEESEFLEKKAANYRMCERSTNPIDYLQNLGIKQIFRFILTHPEMDHLDGFDKLLKKFSVINFWDSGVRREKPDFSEGRYVEADWDRYAKIIEGREPNINVVTPKAGAQFKYANIAEDGTAGGDGLYIMAPDTALVASANDGGDINDASYVILYRSSAGKILIPGDSHDKTWEYILQNHKSDVKDCKVLFAPHHGRKSDRSYDFLDVVNPQLTVFGCAPSEHLAYSAWNYRELTYITQNQAGNIVFDIGENIDVYIENETYAVEYGADSSIVNSNGYCFLTSL